AVHGEDAVGGDELEPAVLALLQVSFQVAHVGVAVAEAPGLAQPDAVDDAGVVQLVGEDAVLVAEDGLEEPAVGVPAGAVEDGAVLAEEGGDGGLELLVQVLGAADEADAGHAVAVALEALPGGGDDGGVVGQPEVVVGAEVEDLAAVDLD